ncbi:hypothetical protein [Micromonospora saelicesensis]|uniref:hypothetical protein n=1 Tax=Micromonospora saelicesensis TaxID=285676 RepID=UPI000DD8553D|nr:hypothetical protein [Micromonospora saelicesensis]
MTLSDETMARYAALDTAALASLVPVLRQESVRAKELLREAEAKVTDDRESDAHLSEVVAESILALELLKEADPAVTESISASQVQMRSLRDSALSDPATNQAYFTAVAQYAFDLLQRERLIKEELARRGLLPQLVLPAPRPRPAP